MNVGFKYSFMGRKHIK